MTSKPIISAQDCRVFWLQIPPLKSAARLEAARLMLRARIANPENTQFALATQANPEGLWCAVVLNASMKSKDLTNAIAEPALAPWQINSVTWVQSDAPYCISAKGESIALEPMAQDNTAQLPEIIIHAVAQAKGQVKTLNIYAPMPLNAQTLALWQAQLGITVQHIAANRLSPHNAAWIAQLKSFRSLTIAHKRTVQSLRWPMVLALFAAIMHFCFALYDYQRHSTALREVQTAMAQLAAQHKTTPAQWQNWVYTQAPQASRRGLQQWLQRLQPALKPNIEQLKSLSLQNGAVSLEWRALSSAEREIFVTKMHRDGVSVIGAGNKARVLWP